MKIYYNDNVNNQSKVISKKFIRPDAPIAQAKEVNLWEYKSEQKEHHISQKSERT